MSLAFLISECSEGEGQIKIKLINKNCEYCYKGKDPDSGKDTNGKDNFK